MTEQYLTQNSNYLKNLTFQKETEEYLSNEWLTSPDQVRCMDGSAVEGCTPDEHCDCCDDEGGV